MYQFATSICTTFRLECVLSPNERIPAFCIALALSLQSSEVGKAGIEEIYVMHFPWKPIVFVLTIVLSNSVCSPLLAQPESSSELRSQLETLKNRIDAAQNNGKVVGSINAPTVGRRENVRVFQPTDHDTMTIRFYDLSKLFSVAPQYPARSTNDFQTASSSIFSTDSAAFRSGSGIGGGAMGGGGGGVFSVPPASQMESETMALSAARVSVDSLIQAIRQSVDPEKWGKGDKKASISILGNTLLISATDPMHQQIDNLLELFQKQWGKLKTVAIEAFWIRSDGCTIRNLLESDKQNRMVGKVDAKKWDEFFKSSVEQKQVAYSATLNGHNGQTLHSVSGRQKLLVLNADPIHTSSGLVDTEMDNDEDSWVRVENSVVGLSPVRAMFQQGAAIQASPLATRGGNFVILDLHTRVNETVESDAAAARVIAKSKSGESLELELDPASYVSFRLSTTIRCPKDEVVLAGGLTYDSVAGGENPNLYLFIRATIHEIEPDENEE